MYRVEKSRGLSRSQWAVLAGAILSILFIFLVTVQQIRGDRQRAVESEIRQNRTRAQVLQQYVLRTLEMSNVTARQLASRLESGAPTLVEATRILDRNAVPQMNYVEGVVVSFGDGERLVTGGISLPPSSWRRLEGFAGRQATPAAISPPFAASNGMQLVALTRRLRGDGSGGFVGIIFEPRHLLDFSRDVQFDRTDLVSLIGLDGITRARREGARVSSGEDLRGRLVMEQQSTTPNGSYYGPSSLDGKWRIFSHRRIPEYGVFATSGVSMDSVLATLAVRRRFQLSMLFAAVLATIAAAGLLVRNIGERRRQLAVLSAANSKLNEAQRIGGMGDWDYWPEADELVWSDNLCALYGRDCVDRATPLRTFGDVMREADLDTVGNGLKSIVRTGKAESWDIVATLGDGRKSHRRIIAEPVLDKNGSVVRIHGVDQSTDQERHLTQLQERLAGHARLDAMNALAATLAHELNQPLGVAANFVAAARRRMRTSPADPEGFEFLDQAEEQIVTVAEIIGAARQSLSGSSADRVEFPISEAIERAMLLIRGHPGESRARISVNIDPGAGKAVGNMALVKQVIHNLVKNAIEAIPSDRQGGVTISTAPDSGGAILFVSVQDNGTGIANGLDPFTALGTHKPEGLGLGLALSRTIVESQGGKIWVERTGVRGTTITFSLPTPLQSAASYH
jgi:two-component system, LuxR family, sensor kinase FixL